KDRKLCAILIEGTCFDDQQLIVALGVQWSGQKLVLGLRQGATENATVVKQMLADMQERGVDFEVPRLFVLDGSKALHAAVRHQAWKKDWNKPLRFIDCECLPICVKAWRART